MVGRAVSEHCRSCHDEVFAYDLGGLEISDAHRVLEAVERDRPEVVKICAA